MIVTHDETVKLHMGKFEQIKSLLDVVCSDYQKNWDSKTYRMREGDIKRVQTYLKEINMRSRVVQRVIRDFKGVV